MRNEPFASPPLRFSVQSTTARTGRLAWAVLQPVVFVAVLGGQVLLVVLLGLLRPFVIWPLLLAAIAGMGATLGFAAAGMWHDAVRAGLATFAAAAVLGLYSRLAQLIDPEHFDQVPSRRRRLWVAEGRCHDDTQ